MQPCACLDFSSVRPSDFQLTELCKIVFSQVVQTTNFVIIYCSGNRKLRYLLKWDPEIRNKPGDSDTAQARELLAQTYAGT